MPYSQDENDYLIISDGVDDYVVFARMDAVQVLATFELRGPGPARVFSKKVQPTDDAFPDCRWQFA